MGFSESYESKTVITTKTYTQKNLTHGHVELLENLGVQKYRKNREAAKSKITSGNWSQSIIKI